MDCVCADEALVSLDEVIEMFKDKKFRKIRIIALEATSGIREFEFINQERHRPVTS